MSQSLSTSVLPQQPPVASSSTIRHSDERVDANGYPSGGGQVPSFTESMKQANKAKVQNSFSTSELPSKEGSIEHNSSEALEGQVTSLPDGAAGALVSLPSNQEEGAILINEWDSSYGEVLGSPQSLSGTELFKETSSERNVSFRLTRSQAAPDKESLSLNDSAHMLEPDMNNISLGVLDSATFLPFQSTTAVGDPAEFDMNTHHVSLNMMHLKSTKLEVGQPSLSGSLNKSQPDAHATGLPLKDVALSELKSDEIAVSPSQFAKLSTIKQGIELVLPSDKEPFLDKMLKVDVSRSPSLTDGADFQKALGGSLNIQSDTSLSASSPSLALASTLTSGKVTVPVNMSFSQPQWGAAMAEKAAWAVSQNIQSVDIQLDPPELGPLQIKVHVHQDQASVNFVSANPAVREALDQSMLRLKDMLQEQGMDLVDSGVSGQSEENSNRDQDAASDDTGITDSELGSDDLNHEMDVVVPSGIDYFA